MLYSCTVEKRLGEGQEEEEEEEEKGDHITQIPCKLSQQHLQSLLSVVLEQHCLSCLS